LNIHTINSDKDQISELKVRLQSRAEEAEKEITVGRAKERALLDNHRRAKEKLEGEKEELSKRLVMLQHKDSQYQVS